MAVKTPPQASTSEKPPKSRGARGYFSTEAGRAVLLTLAAVPMGAIGAGAAWLLYHAIMFVTSVSFYGKFSFAAPVYPPTSGLGWRAVVIPVLGALIVGLMARYGTERIRGHGIPEAMEATLARGSRISARVAFFKPISAAIAVGAGGPFGAEGPIIQTGGAIGSLIGQTFKLTSSERRVLLACGAAAGMVGIFNTPLAAVALVIELLLFEFRIRSLAPVVVASATAASLRPFLLGSGVMFHITAPLTIGSPLNLLWLVPLGILIGIAAALMSKGFYLIEDLFEKLKISMILKPVIGALILGVIAIFEPRVLGMGYPTITATLNGQFSASSSGLLALAKAVAVLFALGSGTSGGALAPLLVVGSALGTAYGAGLQLLIPGLTLSAALCGVVGMSGLFSAAARAPLTSFLFAFELIGDYHVIAPLMIGCMVADLTLRSLSRDGIMSGRLVRRGVRPPEILEPHPLALLNVRDLMSQAVATVRAEQPLREALAALGADGANATRWALPIVTADGILVGMTTRGELFQAGRVPENGAKPACDFATTPIISVTPDEPLADVAERMVEHGYGILPVVATADKDGHGLLVGVLTRGDILRADLLRRERDTLRERFIGVRLNRRQPPTSTPTPIDEAENAENMVAGTLMP